MFHRYNSIEYCTRPGKLVFGFTFVKLSKTSAVISGKEYKIQYRQFYCFPQKTLSEIFLCDVLLESRIFISPPLYGRGNV